MDTLMAGVRPRPGVPANETTVTRGKKLWMRQEGTHPPAAHDVALLKLLSDL